MILKDFNEFSLSRYLENFNEIYSEYDLLIQHETNLDQMHLIIDCHINCEDVTLGLALQYHTPFRFHAKKLWCSYGFTESEYSFKNYDILSLINPNVKFSKISSIEMNFIINSLKLLAFDTLMLKRPIYDRDAS